MIERRAFIVGGVAALAEPLTEGAPQAEKVYRIGYLGNSPGTPEVSRFRDAFRQGLRERGWIARASQVAHCACHCARPRLIALPTGPQWKRRYPDPNEAEQGLAPLFVLWFDVHRARAAGQPSRPDGAAPSMAGISLPRLWATLLRSPAAENALVDR